MVCLGVETRSRTQEYNWGLPRGHRESVHLSHHHQLSGSIQARVENWTRTLWNHSGRFPLVGSLTRKQNMCSLYILLKYLLGTKGIYIYGFCCIFLGSPLKRPYIKLLTYLQCVVTSDAFVQQGELSLAAPNSGCLTNPYCFKRPNSSTMSSARPLQSPLLSRCMYYSTMFS